MFFFEKLMVARTYTQHFSATLGASLILAGYPISCITPYLQQSDNGSSANANLLLTTDNLKRSQASSLINTGNVVFSAGRYIDTCQLIGYLLSSADTAK